MTSFGIKLRVWGERACFTRPEMKSERVSYDVMTPSAARGILEAVYWKPSIKWTIDRIHVMKPVKFENIRRNEVSSKLPIRNVTSAMKEPNRSLGLFIEDDRQQRASMVLRDVEYIIEAHFEALNEDGKNTGKHLDVFKRRARNGQCFNQPYFGCREFSTRFELLEEKVPISEIEGERDLGWMLFDMLFEPEGKKGKRDIRPMFFHAIMANGIIDVPAPGSPEVKR